MRLSSKLNRRGAGKTVCSAGVIRTSADRRVAARAVNGTRQLTVVAPGGLAYIPRADESAVILSSGNEQLCIGVKLLTNERELKPGEVLLFSSDTSYIHLTADGKINICGEVYINGIRQGAE